MLPIIRVPVNDGLVPDRSNAVRATWPPSAPRQFEFEGMHNVIRSQRTPPFSTDLFPWKWKTMWLHGVTKHVAVIAGEEHDPFCS